MKKVLIICYSFPPYPGIGGRRWGKFVKYFVRQNIECHVISAKNHCQDQSVWGEGTTGAGIFHYPIPFRFRRLTTYTGKNIFIRILGRVFRMGVGFTHYSPYFYSSLSKGQLLGAASEVIRKQGIRTVIVSGDPYVYYYASMLKENHDIKLILDFRDLWTDDQSYKRGPQVKQKQLGYFHQCELNAVNRADLVVGVSNVITERLQSRCTNRQVQFKVIPNGFDHEDYGSMKWKFCESDKLTIVHGGNMSAAALLPMIDFLKAYTSLKKSNSALWDSFEIKLMGNFPPNFAKLVGELDNANIIVGNEFESNQKYFQKLLSAHLGIILHPIEYRDAKFITKTFDYFHLNMPILAITYSGVVSEFVDRSNIGFSFCPDKPIIPEEFFKKIQNDIRKKEYSSELQHQLDRAYNIAYLANMYSQEIC